MGSNQELIDRAKAASLQNYRPAPFVLTRGEGRRVWDVEGRRYLDLCAGIAVLSVGHSHPKLAAAIADQAKRLMHLSNLYYNDRAIALATELVRRTGFARAFFCNSGTEANEGLLKLARRYHFERGDPERVELVGTAGSFHGRTMGVLSVTGQPKHQLGMGPLLGGTSIVPYNNLEAMRAVVTTKTAGIIVELIQGEGGIAVADEAYIRGLRALCDERGALLLLDEVQTGYGRTGRFLGQEWFDVKPDAFALAKGIGGGFPLGAMMVSEKCAAGLPPGSHGSTFGGNALACAAGLAVLSIFDEERLVEASHRTGEHLRDGLLRLVGSAATSVRGRGLLQGLVLADDVDPLPTLAAIQSRGVLLSLAGGSVLRFSPPLNVTKDEIDEGLEIVNQVLRDPPTKKAS